MNFINQENVFFDSVHGFGMCDKYKKITLKLVHFRPPRTAAKF